ncbi:hypothetical protein QWQ33_003962 [Salmonella enterica]|nr:hypothetical protein [Salmonella enterica]EBP3303466.1 hypothetical protein [Salmonella enterica subsp. enterica]EDW0654347.1 hypothetical protein [Salmonella enterica subsp. enterica serovar Weslaco]EDX3117220.1 hypothetical protein [Salmonella enterica subsp. enterica serovar Mississippi]EHA8175149.1 hypothetical protein [Salmonella enterica subsp. enterica]
MNKIYIPIRTDIDNEDSDDGYFSLGFVFNYDDDIIPHNIGLCRDELEGEPDSIYIEADDQIYGFRTKKAKYSISDNLLTLTLLDENVFYWDKSKIINIKIDKNEVDEIEECLKSIFNI